MATKSERKVTDSWLGWYGKQSNLLRPTEFLIPLHVHGFMLCKFFPNKSYILVPSTFIAFFFNCVESVRCLECLFYIIIFIFIFALAASVPRRSSFSWETSLSHCTLDCWEIWQASILIDKDVDMPLLQMGHDLDLKFMLAGI